MASSNITRLRLEANYVNWVSMMLIRCYCYTIIPLGVIGHSLSIYVFTRQSLRSNPCARYFLAATVFGLLNTCYNLPMRLIQSGYIDTDPGAHSIVICKTAWFFLYSIRALSFWLIVLACADRYLCSSTSTHMRAWSDVRVTSRAILFTILIGCAVYIHVPIYFKIDVIPATKKPICYPPGPPGSYRIIFSYFNLIYFGLAPPLCMLLFGILTLRNIAHSKRRLLIPSSNSQNATNKNKRTTDGQMLRMIIVQVLVYSVTGLTFSISFIVTATKATQRKNVSQVAHENLIIAIVGMLSNTGPCLSFYLFTLSSSLFRKELKKLFSRLFGTGNQPQRDRSYTTSRDVSKSMEETKL